MSTKSKNPTDRQVRRQRARQARLEAEARQAARALRVRRLWISGAVTGFLAVAAVVGVTLGKGAAPAGPPIPTAAIPARHERDLTRALALAHRRQIDAAPTASAVHVTGHVTYPNNPPLSGPHFPIWPSDGSYVGRTPPPPEKLVHAQEHGRIVIQYTPTATRHQVEQLQALFDEDSSRVVLARNTTHMPYPVAATTWGHGVVFAHFNARVFDAIRAFRDRYRDRGPEYIPRPE